MKECASKLLGGAWVVPLFMGFCLDLSQAWQPYRAAKTALDSIVNPTTVTALANHHRAQVAELHEEVEDLLDEGALGPSYVLANMPALLTCLAACNSTLRWLILHRCVRATPALPLPSLVPPCQPAATFLEVPALSSVRDAHLQTSQHRLREAVLGPASTRKAASNVLLRFLLSTAQLEEQVRRLYEELLQSKDTRWRSCQQSACSSMTELSAFFSGSEVGTQRLGTQAEGCQYSAMVFLQIAHEVRFLDADHAKGTARKLQHLVEALEEVVHFHQIEASLQIKQYLAEVRGQLQEMLLILNVNVAKLARLSVVRSAGHLWGLVEEFIPDIQALIQSEPSMLPPLLCLFLKVASILDMPFLSIPQQASLDMYPVLEYYSMRLGTYMQGVLEIVPDKLFRTVMDIAGSSFLPIVQLPMRVEKGQLAKVAQADNRYHLSRATHQVSLLTQGILEMEQRFMGVIKLDPKRLVEEGLQQRMRGHAAGILQAAVATQDRLGKEALDVTLRSLALKLGAMQQTFACLQDVMHVDGVGAWRRAVASCIAHATEQALCVKCKELVRHSVTRIQQAQLSGRQQLATETAVYAPPVTFMGRLQLQLLHLCDPRSSMCLMALTACSFSLICSPLLHMHVLSAGPDMCRYNSEGQELLGLQTVSLLQSSIGVEGLTSLDRLLSFTAATRLHHVCTYLRNLEQEVSVELPETFDLQLGTAEVVQRGPSREQWDKAAEALALVGQVQLLRRLLAIHLQMASKFSQVDAGPVCEALQALDLGAVSTIEPATTAADTVQLQAVLGNLSRELRGGGHHAPWKQVMLAELSRYIVDLQLCTLTSRSKRSTIDCTPLVLLSTSYCGLGYSLPPSSTIHPALICTGELMCCMPAHRLLDCVKCAVQRTAHSENVEGKRGMSISTANEVGKALVWLVSLGRYSFPTSYMEGLISSYLLHDGLSAILAK
eukprot:SM000069S20686  [mRNA]  locus=s69:228445:234772:+ [translate_table: standard]